MSIRSFLRSLFGEAATPDRIEPAAPTLPIDNSWYLIDQEELTHPVLYVQIENPLQGVQKVAAQWREIGRLVKRTETGSPEDKRTFINLHYHINQIADVLEKPDEWRMVKIPKESLWYLRTQRPFLSETLNYYSRKDERSWSEKGNVSYLTPKTPHALAMYKQAFEQGALAEGFVFNRAVSIQHFIGRIDAFFMAHPAICEDHSSHRRTLAAPERPHEPVIVGSAFFDL